ncbi:uncharacterized protein LOC120908415 isoform X1 [Anopheles arabiensis]|uniref:uncharacterized protein LOC120908415 isoform X1 n=1 Tax=Anopheles arabiensis TaxID=7173 RepID=UPI001AADA1EA|nr:uncharacterized protein LOC120908415 isoform X1 [Anopheles arabiensis]
MVGPSRQNALNAGPRGFAVHHGSLGCDVMEPESYPLWNVAGVFARLHLQMHFPRPYHRPIDPNRCLEERSLHSTLPPGYCKPFQPYRSRCVRGYIEVAEN